MEKLAIKKADLVLAVVAGLLLLLICFGFGYFFGRYEQVQMNRELLKVVPEVNCGTRL